MEIKGIRGQFNATLDDKGRLMLPAKLRNQLPLDTLVLTKSVEQCLWLFPVERWNGLVEVLTSQNSLFKEKTQQIYRRLIAPAEEITLDKSGRVKLLPSLMKSVGLDKDCYLIGMDDHVEIWDERKYEEYEAACASSIRDGWNDLAEMGDLGF